MSEIILPVASCRILTRHFIVSDWYQRLQDATLEELTAKTVDVKKFWPNSLLHEVSFSIRELTANEKAAETRRHFHGWFRVIEFTTLSVDHDRVDSLEIDDVEGFEREDLVNFGLEAELTSFCELYLFLVMVASWGAFEPQKVHRGNSPPPDDDASFVGLFRGHEVDEFLASDLTSQISLESFLIWSATCEGVWSGNATTNLEKGLSFLSNALHAAETQSDVSRLLWSFAGLEAIAAESNVGVKKFLTKRIPPLCDALPVEGLPKKIGEAYDLRSRILHGDVSVHNRFSEEEENYDSKRYDSRAYSFGMLMSVVLMSVIINAAKAGAREIQFIEHARYV